MIFFTSDQHFFHANAIANSKRRFSDVEEMNEVLIRNWNESVQPEDEIYILGDFTMKGPGFAMRALKVLNGKKYLVRGNHDRFWDKSTFDFSLLEWVKDYHILKYKDIYFVLFHYPILSWNHMYRGSIHLHGHQHNPPSYNEENRRMGLRRYDVGVDANDMRPVSVEHILDFFGISGPEE